MKVHFLFTFNMDVTTSNLQKCKKCRKSLPLEAFINENTRQYKTCNICRFQSSLQSKQSNKFDSELDLLTPKEMSNRLFEKILEIDANEYLETDLTGIDFSCNISVDMIDGDPKKISKTIVELLGESDGYYYIYKDSYNSKKEFDVLTFWYKCSQCQSLAKKPRKHESIENQRDQIPIERFDCNGSIKITLKMEIKIATIHLQHSIIHKRPERFGIDESIKEEIRKNIHLNPSDIYRILECNNSNLTQKQVHAWWSTLIKQKYIRNNEDQLDSAEILLKEYGYQILLDNTKDGVKFLSFITPFFEKMFKNQEIIVDATYKTNILGYELYAVIGQFDGAGFAMAYLFIEGSKKNDGARTEILLLFFKELYNLGMNNIQFFLTDKDFAQISAAQHTWPNVKIQICLWHIKKALKKRFADNTQPKITTYSSNSAHEIFDFVDVNFYPIITTNEKKSKKDFYFCPQALRSKIIEILEIHMHWHPLIPNINGYYLSAEEIWREAVYEMYEFCFANNLRNVWAYLWTNWYRKEIWILWARSAIQERICIFRTTMLSESHWKVIKRDYLPKFFRPRLDLVIYILLTRLTSHHQQQYNKYLCGCEKPS